MVTSATSLTQSGLRDWLIQRVTAIILGIYTVFILAYLGLSTHLDYATWHSLFTHEWIRVFSFLTLLSLIFHAWVGIWTVLTDYVKPFAVRIVLEVLLVLSLFSYLAWGIAILWGF